MSTHIDGASVWEQEIFDFVTEHVAIEGAMLDEYRQIAEDPSISPAFRYLAGLILTDERRHHRIFSELAESIRQMANLRLEDEPIPSIQGLERDRDRIMDITERLLADERDDAKKLKQLAKKFKDVRETTMWGLLIELMQADTAKHIKILEFIRDRATHPVV
jgi:hypothetical protein